MGTFTNYLLLYTAILFFYGAHTIHGDESELSWKAPHFTKLEKMNKHYYKVTGQMLRLKCSSDGNPIPNITWYKDNEIPSRKLGTIKYVKWSLIMEDFTLEDSGIYRCVVCNKLGCVDYNYTVEVLERFISKPIVTEYPQNQTVTVGRDANITCKFLSDLQVHIFWNKGKNDKNNLEQVIGILDANSETLQLYNVTHDYEGWYTCTVSNTLGTTFGSAYLEVIDDTNIITQQNVTYTPT